MCRPKGMEFNPQPVIPFPTVNPGNNDGGLVTLHKDCEERSKAVGPLQLLIIVLHAHVADSYGLIKRICETELGIVSQCCQPKQAMKCNKAVRKRSDGLR